MVFEKKLTDKVIRIEARKSGEYWEVFKTIIKGNKSSLIAMHTVDDITEAKSLIEELKSDKEKAVPLNKNLNVSLKRNYKEDFFEKWTFNIGNSEIQNVIIVRIDNQLVADIILHDQYRYYEKEIIEQIEDKLGFNDIGETLSYDIYYFKRHSKEQRQVKTNEYSFIDVEFGFDEE